jgi:putative endonuclease
MTSSRQSVGRLGESLAAEYLTQRGYTIQTRNARTPYGELDLVATQPTIAGNVTVFIEVKTRRSNQYGLPEASITPQKQAHLLAAAQAYLQAQSGLDDDWRIDVIAIRLSGSALPEIVHYENAVSA